MASREQTVEVRVRPRLDAVVVSPEDTLVIRMSADITREQFEEHVARIKERLPGVEVLFIACEQMLVYRPGDPVDKPGKPPADTSWLRSLDV